MFLEMYLCLEGGREGGQGETELAQQQQQLRRNNNKDSNLCRPHHIVLGDGFQQQQSGPSVCKLDSLARIETHSAKFTMSQLGPEIPIAECDDRGVILSRLCWFTTIDRVLI